MKTQQFPCPICRGSVPCKEHGIVRFDKPSTMMEANPKVDKNSSHSKRHERQEDSDDDCDTNGCISEREQLTKNMNKIDLNYDGAKQKLLDAWDQIRHLREAVKIYRPLHKEDCCCVACGAFNRFCVEKKNEEKPEDFSIDCANCGKKISLVPRDDEVVCYMEHKRICERCYDKFVDEVDVNDII